MSSDLDAVKELKPCPFCGGKAEWHNIGNEYTKSRATKIWCSDCRFTKRVGAIRHSLDWTRDHAITAWNRRIESHRGRIEMLEETLRKIIDHWACDYDHQYANTEQYRGPYGIGIVDGHRACAIIARSALTPSDS